MTTKCSAERLIEALIRAQIMEQQHRAEAARREAPPLVVTLSRGYGSRGKELGQALADRLGVRCCDRDILEAVAREAELDVDLIHTLDEHVSHIQGDGWHGLLSRPQRSHQRYFQHLVKIILSISRTGGVIVGRGAHLILGPGRAFRLRVVGSLDVCAQRIVEREGLDLDAARARVRKVDRERAEYIREVFHHDPGDPSVYELTLNSDRYRLGEMLEIVVYAMQRAGFGVPAGAAARPPV